MARQQSFVILIKTLIDFPAAPASSATDRIDFLRFAGSFRSGLTRRVGQIFVEVKLVIASTPASAE
jgi:hypothetical protein